MLHGQNTSRCAIKVCPISQLIFLYDIVKDIAQTTKTILFNSTRSEVFLSNQIYIVSPNLLCLKFGVFVHRSRVVKHVAKTDDHFQSKLFTEVTFLVSACSIYIYISTIKNTQFHVYSLFGLFVFRWICCLTRKSIQFWSAYAAKQHIHNIDSVWM